MSERNKSRDPRPFCFETSWIKHSEFKERVAEIWDKHVQSHNIVVKVVFGDRVDVLNDFFYQPGGSMLLVKILCEALETLCKKSSIVTGIIFLR